MGTIGVVAGGGQLVRLADEYNQLAVRVKTATRDTGDFDEVLAHLRETAIQTGAGLLSTVATFQDLSRVREDLGATNAQMLQLTRTVNQLGVIGGSSTEAMKNGLRQFNQAMSAGVFRAEEFNSIIENTPELASRIAKGLGKTQGQLRQMVIQGKLFSEDVINTLLKQAPDIAEQFKTIPTNLDRAFAALKTTIGSAASAVDKSSGFTLGMAEAVTELARGVEKLGEALVVFVGHSDDATESGSALGAAFIWIAEISLRVASTFEKVGRALGGVAAMAVLVNTGQFRLAGVVFEKLTKDNELATARFEAAIARLNGVRQGPAAPEGFGDVNNPSEPEGGDQVGGATVKPITFGPLDAKEAEKLRKEHLKAIADFDTAILVAGFKAGDARVEQEEEIFEAMRAHAAETNDAIVESTWRRAEGQIKAIQSVGDAEVITTRESSAAWDKYVLDAIARRTRLNEELAKKAEELEDKAKAQRDAFSQMFGDNMVQAAETGFDSILKSWVKTLQQMLAKALASKIFDLLAGTKGGKSGVGSAIIGFFSGAREKGGPVAGGSTYLVGEKGPELFMPNSSGSIVSNKDLQTDSSAISKRVESTTSSINENVSASSVRTESSEAINRLVEKTTASVTDLVPRIQTGGTDSLESINKMVESTTSKVVDLFPELDGARAKGGPVSGGGAFLVGEKGPEIFVPKASGEIVPNNKIANQLGSGSRVDEKFLEKSNSVSTALEKMVEKTDVLGFPKIAGARASGGPVSGGASYMVGERGPELFVPSSTATSNNGGGTVNHFTIDARGATPGVVPMIEAGMKRAVAEADRNRNEARRRGA